MTSDHVADFTSTGSKRPEVLFGTSDPSLPSRMTRSAGYRVWDEEGREYLDFIMGLGAVALGYAYPAVTQAVARAAEYGVVGPFPPVLEEELAAELCRLIPWIEQLRFLKTGAEALAAAVRLARVATGRDRVLGCGYHGWLDWCETRGAGVPAATRALYAELPFNDPELTRELIRTTGDQLAAVVFEPVVLAQPTAEWLGVLQEETRRCGAVLVVDEVKTICRLAIGGAAERYGFRPDLVVMAKAIANGFPVAAVGGRADIMARVSRTWISSTLATEFVSLAAARQTLRVMQEESVPRHIAKVGGHLFTGLQALAERHPSLVAGVSGIPEMCFLQYRDEDVSQRVTAAAARLGVLFKRSAYNFVSLAHDEAVIKRAIGVLDEALSMAAVSA
ncbi:MAG TPA: aminotransferase class III-fold pyridoxal phosphate-dependent enzyme [Gemmatimonadales bacterium]